MAENTTTGNVANRENVDIENRPRTWRAGKPVLAVQQKPQQRVALGNITSKSTNVRIQPTKTKLSNFENEAAAKKSQAGKGRIVTDTTTSFRPFTIHQDEEELDTSEQLTMIKEKSAEVTKPALDSSISEILSSASISLDTSQNEVSSVKDSPMVVDVSCLEDKVLDDRPIDRDLYYASGYFEEIYQNLLKAEKKNRPKASYLKKQQDITSSMRGILIDWLVEVGEEYKLQNETLYLAVNYIDRFLSCMAVLRSKLQLVGAAAMFIAAKFEEIFPPDVTEFVYITDDTYNKKQVLRMEHLILKVLSFDLVIPSQLCFLQRFATIDNLDETTECLAMYLSELTLLEADPYLYYVNSIIGAAAVCLANHTMGREPWSSALVEETGYQVADFYPCLASLYKTFTEASNFPQQAIREKYKGIKYHQVALLNPPSSWPF